MRLVASTCWLRGVSALRAGSSSPSPVPADTSSRLITYFCGVAKGDFVDASLPGTGSLAGAVNREYDRGPSVLGHERIKEDPVVFADFLGSSEFRVRVRRSAAGSGCGS